MAESVVIVGAGVIGAAIAFRLAEAGARVTVVDAALPASGASGRSFGWINASFSVNAEHFRLRVAAMAAHHALAADLGGAPTEWPGAISWEEEGPAEEETFARLQAAGYPVRRLARAEIAALEPGLPAPPASALFFPSEGVTDLARLTHRLLGAAEGHGARLLLGLPVEGIVTRNGAACGVATGDGTVAADRVVIAAGTGAPGLLAPLGLALPMLHRPALILRTAPLPPLLRHILVTPLLELRQEADGRILAPTSPGHQGDASERLGDTPAALASDALARLRTVLPGLDLDWREALRAERPVPGDGLPAVGPAGLPGLYLAVMHSGATLAALIGRAVARDVLGEGEEPLLAPYRPTRFA